MRLYVFAWLFSAGMIVLGSDAASAQNYPNKPIRIVTNVAGGGGDFVARQIAQALTLSLGQPLIVENRGSQTMLTDIVTRAPPDGYTLMICPDSLWIGPLLREMPYDPVRDFSAIAIATRAPNVLVVYPPLPVKSVPELIALAKAKPGELNYGSGSTGGSNHLAAELFKAMAGVNIMRVNYKGSGPAMNALIGGEIQVMFPNAAAGMPHIKSGRLRALAVGSAEPSALTPGLVTVAASGLHGYESASTVAAFAPAKTPKTIVNRLNQEIVRFLNTVETKERLLNAGLEIVGSSPEQSAATIKSEMTRLGKVIKDAGIREE